MSTIDLTAGARGCDYAFDSIDDGMRGRIVGWSTPRPRPGDYLILRDGPAVTTRYRVTSVETFRDPPDMFRAEVEFAPRDAPDA